MTEQLSATLLTIEILAAGTPLPHGEIKLHTITIRSAYNAAIPLLKYYAEDNLNDLEKDLPDLLPKLNQHAAASPKIVLSKTLNLKTPELKHAP
jgi:hypothetical protein